MVHDLYQEIILDHSKRPRNCHPMDDANRKAEGYNPLCGDKLKLYLKMENDVVKDVSFVGSGCAISTASASLMTESMKGKTREEALKAMEKFHDLLTTTGLQSAFESRHQTKGGRVANSGVGNPDETIPVHGDAVRPDQETSAELPLNLARCGVNLHDWWIESPRGIDETPVFFDRGAVHFPQRGGILWNRDP